MSDDYPPQVQRWIDEFMAWRDRTPDECDRVLDGVRSMKLHRPTRIYLTTEGFMFPFTHAITMDDIHEVIGADALDTVTLVDHVHVLCLDDQAVAKKLPVNARATKFYFEKCGGRVPWEIRGDAVIVPDADFAPPHMRGMYE